MIPEISVIIPVYNAESYIEECLNSVMTQTFRNIEVVLIDDGSEDLSNEIMQSFCIKDKRFKLFSQSNAGVSAARNEGIKRSAGRYIFFWIVMIHLFQPHLKNYLFVLIKQMLIL
ncbi:MAG: glycosyltransferase family 2 protein [Tannerellaceae bacterium]|nr:glycosyltransferase family 2 protein [Tannerellaceae bacterium]